jgi:multiple antibiotic resistance protein
MPSLSGPGAIAVVLSVSSEIERWHGYLVVALGILITAIISYWVLRGSARLTRFLGVNGLNIFTRIMGFLLICIAVQFLATGIFDFIEKGIPNSSPPKIIQGAHLFGVNSWVSGAEHFPSQLY